ncbi:MAG TPA: hypothetical protein PLB52_03365 [Candidatus Moranbacteria bacterium]|nr:hypothetical protein [Candidatus Moranbacteria bacterium]
MLKKCALFIRGCIRMRTMIIVLILLVTVYVFKNKFEEISNLQIVQESRQSGALFYLEGIWGKMKNFQRMNEGRMQRTSELFENAKTFREKSGLFSIKVPEKWIVVSEEGANGGQIVKVVIESPLFSERREGGSIFYDDGAQLTSQVVRGEQSSAKLADGGHGKMLIRSGNVNVLNQNTKYHIIQEENVKKGEIFDAHIVYNGNTCNVRLVDNPQIFIGSEFSFQEILASLEFNK